MLNTSVCGTEGPKSKLPYTSPSLRTYGSVGQLTMAMTSGPLLEAMNTMVRTSDPAVKENVARIGDHPEGFGLYLFDYKTEFKDAFGHGRQFGVMADEVERIRPDAVSVGADGYRRVSYDLLGIRQAKN